MRTTYYKTADLITEILGHQSTTPVQIAYVIDPGSEGEHDEPPVAEFVEVLSIRKVLHSDLGADIMPLLDASQVDALEREIADELVAA